MQFQEAHKLFSQVSNYMAATAHCQDHMKIHSKTLPVGDRTEGREVPTWSISILLGSGQGLPPSSDK